MSRLPSLRGPRDFRRVLDAGRRGRSDGITVFATPALDEGRVGIVVPRRVGGAVDRNRVKRRLRAILGPLDARLGHDLVVRAEGSARSLSFQDLENHVVRAVATARAAS